MQAIINIINVEDGDAIIVQIKDAKEKSLILIDGGYKKYYPRVKKRLEELLPLYNNQIDLLICTHYDNDHIGGVENILQDYHTIIQEIWMHKIENNLDDTLALINKQIQALPKLHLIALENYSEELFINNNIALEGYKDLLRVIKKIKEYGLENKIREVKQGDYFEKFPEFSVISPSATYYNSLLPKLKSESIIEDAKKDQETSTINDQVLESINLQHLESHTMIDYCAQLLRSSIQNGVTATNMVSIVTLLSIGEKRFLFPGDAGIESFEPNTTNWKEDLKNLYFLLMPHHGSKNNISKEMLDIFNPKHVIISAKNSENRPSHLIEKCLQQKGNVHTYEVTNAIKETWYVQIDDNGNFERILL